MDLPYESPEHQFILLSSTSNFHKFGYPVISEFSLKSVIMPTHITYAEHVLYDPFCKEDMEGSNIRKYIPVSPCNRIMYFLTTFKEAEMYHILCYLLLKDQGTDEPLSKTCLSYTESHFIRRECCYQHTTQLCKFFQNIICHIC